MSGIRLERPGGLIPRLSPSQLPTAGGAREASLVSLAGGQWVPLRRPKVVFAPAALTQTIRSIFRLDDTTWLVWPVAGVRAVRAPLSGEDRYVITGNGPPQLTTASLAKPVTPEGLPAVVRPLGVPAGTTAPTVSHSGGVGAAVTRVYKWTFYTTDLYEEGAASAESALVTGKVDGTWSIGGMPAAPPNTGTVTAVTKTASTVTLTLGAAPHFHRVGESLTVSGVLGMTDLNATHVITAVPAVNQVTVALATAQSYTSGGTWARVIPWPPIAKRLYRQVGTTGSMQLVAENITGTSYSDTLTDANIPGDELVSEDWDPAPIGLTGVVAMDGGMLWGFEAGTRTLRCCEPFQPHAWPAKYKVQIEAQIVALAAWDMHLAVGTLGVPRILSGNEPGAMTPISHGKAFPCLAAASMCATNNGVVFASREGLVQMTLANASIMSADIWTGEQWRNLSLADMQVAFDGQQLFISAPGEKRLLALDMVGPGRLTYVSQDASALYIDPLAGGLRFAVGFEVFELNPTDTAPQMLDWRSGDFVLPAPANMGACRIEVDEEYLAEARARLAEAAGDVTAANAALMARPWGGRGAVGLQPLNRRALNASDLTRPPDTEPAAALTLYAADRMAWSGVIPVDGRGFKLGAGYKTGIFSVRLQANTAVRAISLAETLNGLKAV